MVLAVWCLFWRQTADTLTRIKTLGYPQGETSARKNQIRALPYIVGVGCAWMALRPGMDGESHDVSENGADNHGAGIY